MYLSFSGCCYFLSAVVNPFLYSLLSKRFRRGYHDLVRNTKIWFRNLPILLHITSPPTTTKESDRIVSADLVPSIHTSSQQGRDCIVNNMCCSGTVIKKAVYKFNTNSKKIQDNRQSIYLSPNSNIPQSNVDDGSADMIEMVANNHEAKLLIRYSNQSHINNIASESNVPNSSKKTLRFASDLTNDEVIKSEGYTPDHSKRTCKFLFKSRKFKGEKIVSEGCAEQMVVCGSLDIPKFMEYAQNTGPSHFMEK